MNTEAFYREVEGILGGYLAHCGYSRDTRWCADRSLVAIAIYGKSDVFMAFVDSPRDYGVFLNMGLREAGEELPNRWAGFENLLLPGSISLPKRRSNADMLVDIRSALELKLNDLEDAVHRGGWSGTSWFGLPIRRLN